MYLRCFFIFTQLKATLRAGWKGAGVGGQRAEDGEAEVIHLGRYPGWWQRMAGTLLIGRILGLCM